MAWGEQPLFRERQRSEARAFRPPETWRGGGGGGTSSSSSRSPLGCGSADPELGGHGPAPRPRSPPGTGEAAARWGQPPAPGERPLGPEVVATSTSWHWQQAEPSPAPGRFFLMGSQPHLWGLSTPGPDFGAASPTRLCHGRVAAQGPCPPLGMGTSLALAAVSWLPPLLVVLLLLCS